MLDQTSVSLSVIGLTGPSGAGKGEVGRCFTARGIPVLDTDRIYHELLIPPSPCLDELVKQFGTGILTSDGQLDRAVMASLVFSDSEQAKNDHAILNRITHRFVIDRTAQLIGEHERKGAKAVVIDAPLLIESGLDRACRLVIAVLADRELRLERLIAREGKTKEQLSTRLNAQPDEDFYRKHADVVIENNDQLNLLQERVDEILSRLGLRA